MSRSRLLYTLLICLLAPLLPLYLLWRSRRQPAYRQHWGERLGYYRQPGADAATLTAATNPHAPLIWLHAVSVGETRATQPLVKAIRQRWPQARLLLSHMTPTGRQTAAELYGQDPLIRSVYLPYDFPWAMRRFLHHFQPQLGLIMETELWPNLVALCQQNHLPLLLANARLSEKSARGYARHPQLTAQTLQALSAIAAQSADDAARLQQLGANQVHITGNLKFDIQPPADLLQRGHRWRQQWCPQRPSQPPRRILLAASTREGEEALILDAWQRHLDPNWLLLIVPRHPQRFDAVAALATRRGFHTARRSQLNDHAASTPALTHATQVLIGDSMGELFAYYAACDVAFIGGSLLDYGSQNLIEACAVGVPVLIGPSTYNFQEAAQAALAAGAAQQIQNADELFSRAQTLITAPASAPTAPSAGLNFIAHHQGASARTLQLMEKLLTT
ncbi:MAG: lipid IV(A) 3-deoxy-D-manno-octulosonic acid transferase [Sterolibacterium sp.]|nr:lipid IV(A) 3-deoxy-D-manno-octulosonic acid transferase [Sterolibacterium sp.]